MEPAEEALADPQIDGGLAAISAHGLIGWAWRPQLPTRPVTVVVQANGIEVGRAVADRMDAETIGAHGRPGVPGFCLRLTHLPGGLYPLALTLHDETGGRIGGRFMVNEIAQLIPITDAVAAEYEGAVDTYADGVISGWARNAALPALPVSVDLFDGSKLIGRTRADMLREDLRLAGKGSGRHGYRIILSHRLLDGRAHLLRVRIAGSRFELPGGPFAFGPLDPGDPMAEINDLRGEIRRLAERVDALSDPASRYVSDIVRRLSERVAALAEVQRESIERELDALRRFAFADRSHGDGPKP